MNVYLIWLAWPEACFRLNDGDLSFFRSLVPSGSDVVCAWDEAGFLAELPRATHVLTWHFRREWFSLAPRLRLVATPAAGREFVATDAPEGVQVHFGGFHGAIISETVLGFVLAWSHGLFRRAPLWPRADWSGVCRTLGGTTAVVAGYGKVGRAIGARLGSFGARVFGLTRHGVFEGDADEPSAAADEASLLARADWLILALPGDTGTDGFLDAARIAALPPTCVVVNVGRGNAVDEAALADALRAGRIAGAYLDVFRHEPTVLNPALTGRPVSGDDLANAADSELPPNLVRTPHASAYSPDYLRMFFRELKDENLV